MQVSDHTAKSTTQRIASGKPLWRLLFLLGTLLALPVTAHSLSSADRLAQLQTEVRLHALAYYQKAKAKKLEINVSSLDPRLQLRNCPEKLTILLNDPSYNGGNQTAQARCDGDNPWSIYVPLNVALFFEYPVASKNLNRGDIINAGDIQRSLVNTTNRRQGQISDNSDLIGKAVRRPIRQGEVFRAAQLELPTVVKRGDIVSIETTAGAISVSSSGTAMANGKPGDRIRVKNNQSDRIIQVEVVASGTVRTI